MAYWKNVEARTEVHHDGDVLVARRLFWAELNRRNALSELGAERMSTFGPFWGFFGGRGTGLG
jgi:hypothetical protein